MRAITARLSVMMFLQFFIWGCWFVTLGTFLAANFQASGAQTGMAFSTQSWGAIIAPFIIGLIADRYFNAERILAVLHLAGAVLMYQMYSAPDFTRFYPYVLAYMIAYMPTLALVNSISFRQLTDPSRQFSLVRVWGTVGWIVAGLVISFVFHWDSQAAVASGASRRESPSVTTASRNHSTPGRTMDSSSVATVSAISRHVSLRIGNDHLPNVLRKCPGIVARHASCLDRRMHDETNVTRRRCKAALQHHMPASDDRQRDTG